MEKPTLIDSVEKADALAKSGAPAKPDAPAVGILTAIFGLSRSGWQMLLRSRKQLSQESLAGIAAALKISLPDPENLQQSRELLMLHAPVTADLTPKRLRWLERTTLWSTRISGLWLVAWLNLIPTAVVAPWAVPVIRESIRSQDFASVVLYLFLSGLGWVVAAFVGLLLCGVLGRPFFAVVHWLLGIQQLDPMDHDPE